jgi:tetratricopeptide (TPR) repeat protein
MNYSKVKSSIFSFIVLLVILLLMLVFCTFSNWSTNICGLFVLKSIKEESLPCYLDRFCYVNTQDEDVSIHRLRGQAAALGGNIEGAYEHLATALRMDSDNRLIAYWLGLVEEQRGNYARALILMNQAGNNSYWPEDLDLWLSQDRKIRLRVLSESLSGHDVSPYAHFQLGKLFYELDPKIANQYFGQSIEGLKGKDLQKRCTSIAGFYFYDAADSKLAKNWAKKATIVFEENYQYPHQILGEIYRDEGNWSDAINEFNRAISYSNSPSERARVQTKLGNVYLQLGDYDKAIKLLLESTKHHHDPFGAYYGLSEAYLAKSDCEKAMEFYHQVDALSEDSREDAIQKLQTKISSRCSQDE